ncbi:MAG: hypothetical protein JWO23_2696 [Solirubrobacterales bacterium]|nr:hypothetical protein [Solirubrobacterales bacterium]
MLALAASLAVIALTFGAPPQALARARSSTCRHSSTSRTVHGHRACAKSRRKPRAHSHRPAKHGNAKRARGKVTTGATAVATTKASSKKAPASCEDAGEPRRVADEVFECEDGSEPRCEAGSTLALSDDGSTLLCSAVLAGTPGSGEESCQAGSTCSAEPGEPACAGAGASSSASASLPACEESGEEGCEAGSSGAQSGDPVLPCAAPAEESGESAAVARQLPVPRSSQAASASYFVAPVVGSERYRTASAGVKRS